MESSTSSTAIRAASTSPDPSAGHDRLLKQSAVQKRCADSSRATIFRWRKIGKFPEPDIIVGNRPLWRESTIDKWIATGKVDQENIGDDHGGGS